MKPKVGFISYLTSSNLTRFSLTLQPERSAQSQVQGHLVVKKLIELMGHIFLVRNLLKITHRLVQLLQFLPTWIYLCLNLLQTALHPVNFLRFLLGLSQIVLQSLHHLLDFYFHLWLRTHNVLLTLRYLCNGCQNSRVGNCLDRCRAFLTGSVL